MIDGHHTLRGQLEDLADAIDAAGGGVCPVHDVVLERPGPGCYAECPFCRWPAEAFAEATDRAIAEIRQQVAPMFADPSSARVEFDRARVAPLTVAERRAAADRAIADAARRVKRRRC